MFSKALWPTKIISRDGCLLLSASSDLHPSYCMAVCVAPYGASAMRCFQPHLGAFKGSPKHLMASTVILRDNLRQKNECPADIFLFPTESSGMSADWNVPLSETGRIRFRGVRFQTPNSVSFFGLTEFRGASSVSSS